jgi:hypothetical protein
MWLAVAQAMRIIMVTLLNGANADIVKPTALPEIQYGSRKGILHLW